MRMSNNSNIFESDGWLFRPFNEAMHRANILMHKAQCSGDPDLAKHLEQFQNDLTQAYFTLIKSEGVKMS